MEISSIRLKVYRVFGWDPLLTRQSGQLALACQLRLRQFDTSTDEDEVLLKGEALPPRLRNAVRVRHGEKMALKYFRGLAPAAMPMSSSRDAKDKFAKYFGYIAPLLS